MSERKAINEEILEQVVGGFFSFNGNTNILTYTHGDGTVTKHKILKYSEAWKMSNDLHGKNVPEDQILSQMISKGYIEG